MTAIIDNYLLSKMLRDDKSWEQIEEFCSTRRGFCFGNKAEFCKKILKAKFKNVVKGSDYCGILLEFIKVKRHENSLKNTTGPLNIRFTVTKEFIEVLSAQGKNTYPKLEKFLEENGVTITRQPTILLSQLANSPLIQKPRIGDADTINIIGGSRIKKRKRKN